MPRCEAVERGMSLARRVNGGTIESGTRSSAVAAVPTGHMARRTNRHFVYMALFTLPLSSIRFFSVHFVVKP